MIDNNILKSLFGKAYDNSNVIYKMITDEINKNKFEYFYLTPEAFREMGKKKGASWINQYSCNEILQRIYFATITGYLRQSRWIEGICNGANTSNYLAFAASLRGFLESVTDYYDALYRIPLTLAEQYKLINRALKGEVTDFIITYKEIEDILLHFQEANKNDGKTYLLLNPKFAKAYMENEHLKHLDLYQCYGELCEITHPAKNSLELFIDEKNYFYSFNNEKDKILIKDFICRHSERFSELFMRFENLCIINLQLLNLFKIDRFYSKSVESINTEGIKIWEKINQYIK
jgi:hypothetical protein